MSLILRNILSISFHISLISISRSLISTECEFTLTDSNNITSDYDLSRFYFTNNNIHQVDDSTNPDFQYKFNICGSISKQLFVANTSIPSYCLGLDKGPCIDFKDYSNGTVICNEIYPDTSTKVPSAVQIVSSSTEHSCFWLGMELNITQFPNYKIDLIDTDNSGAGLIFTILNGQFCASGYNMNRELSVSLKCPDSTQTEWDMDLAKVINEPVIEWPICVYSIQFESPLACPQNCVTKISTNSYSVCSTHGICAADPNIGHSRCICDDGFGGDLCENVISGVQILDVGNEDLMTAIVICIVLTAICCGIAVYLWYIWRKTLKINKILDEGNPTNEYFLNIDDEVEEDDDTLHSGINTGASPTTKDTFHPIVSVDVSTAKMIQKEHQKQQKKTIEDEEKEKEKEMDHNQDEDGNEIEEESEEEDHHQNIANYQSDPDEQIPADDEIDYVE